MTNRDTVATSKEGRRQKGLTAEALLAWAETDLVYALQPIVNVHSGGCFGMEALMRGFEKLGFNEAEDVMDFAATEGILHRLDVILRERAIDAFAGLNPSGADTLLFFNLDNRIPDSLDYEAGITQGLLERHHLPSETIVFEISERHQMLQEVRVHDILQRYHGQGYRLAIDDFGTGHSGLTALFDSQPEFVKVDQFFISDIDKDSRKRVFLNSIVKLAHVLGAPVVAEGVETEGEFLTVKEIGCDMVQGFFTGPPKTDWYGLPGPAHAVTKINHDDRREQHSDAGIIFDQIEPLEPLHVQTPMSEVFERFRADKDMTYFPVVDSKGHPVGLIREKDLKEFTYSTYGKELISNKSYSHKLRDFATPCPTADIRTEAEEILELFSLSSRPEGMIITKDFKYLGFLSAASLLRVINEKNLSYARDQNPLSKLPGNNVINHYMTGVVDKSDHDWTVVYFDFNNFKPFNDTYGFRQGDRAILLFSELLRKTLATSHTFIGHIGGDDFFAGFCDAEVDNVTRTIANILQRFAGDVRSFYSEKDRTADCVTAMDRTGKSVCFPLLACSAAITHVQRGRPRNLEAIMALITDQKKAAKRADDNISVACFVG